MDKYIFRGKRLDNNQWTYGFLSFIYTNGKNENGVIYTGKARMYCPEDCCSYDVDLKTVGQYTGLKDKNKMLIYGGDIVTKRYITPIGELTRENDFDFKKEIKFLNGCFGIYTNTEFKTLHDFINYHCGDYIPNCGNKIIYDDCNLIVIGNIYENPELLEGKNV